MQSLVNYYEQHRDEFRLPSCWRSINNCVLPHFHGSFELVYVENGEMEAQVNGETIVVRSGELLLIPVYFVHRFFTPESSDTIVLIIPPDYIGRFASIARGKQFAHFLVSGSTATERIVDALHFLLTNEDDKIDTECHDSLETRGLIYTILGILLETVPLCELPKESGQNPISDILIYLGNEFAQPIGVNTLASKLGYSRSHISHLFKKNVGVSIPEYLNLLRTRSAAEILLHSKTHTITEAAMESGFDSMRTFYRAFKYHFNVTPSRYLKLTKDEQVRLVQGGLYFPPVIKR